MKKQLLITTLLIFLTLCKSIFAANEIDIVTYADFSHIRDITVSMNSVYFATTEGIIQYDKFSESWQQPLTGAPGVDYQNIFKLYIDQFDRKLYARTEMSSYEYDILFKSWFYTDNIPELENHSYEVAPSRIMYVPDGYLYTGDGTVQDFNGYVYPINKMIDDGSGMRWLSLWGKGAARASISDIIEFLPYGLLQNRVNKIFYSDGVIVVGGDNIGSTHTGITFFDYDNNEFQYKESGLTFEFPDEDISCFEEDENYLYVGTAGGLFLLDIETLEVKQKITERHGLIDDQLLSLKKVEDKLYIGTENGLQILSGDSDSLSVVFSNQFQNHDIYDFELTDTTLWIASEVGAYQLNLSTNELKKFQDPHKIIFSSAFNIERAGANLFIASQNGMIRLNLKTGVTSPYISNAHGSNFRALAVNDDVAFISTDYGFNLFYLDESGYDNEREFTTSEGLPSQFIYDLLLDGDYLWIGSDQGLSLFYWNDPDRID